MFSSDWAFGYGEYWKQFFCLHEQVKCGFLMPKAAGVPVLSRRGLTFKKGKDEDIKIEFKCKRCNKLMGEEVFSPTQFTELYNEYTEFITKGEKTMPTNTLQKAIKECQAYLGIGESEAIETLHTELQIIKGEVKA